ncbi:MAG: hypothetical protein SCM11_12590 [Bacillota bacterium]|nr:hypothetical protein [Bacillota bacterium]
MKVWRRLSLCLCVSLLLTVTACSSEDGFWLDDLTEQIRSIGRRQPNAGNLSVHELVQKIADAIKNDANITSAYDGIPDRQKDGLTLDQFQQYIRLLRRGTSGSVTSFTEMSDDEITDVRSQIGEQLPDQADNVADISGFWIHYQESGRAAEKFAIYVRESEGQTPDLYGDWVRQILDLQDLALLYFDALDRYDEDALSFLLQPQDLPEDIIALRAERLIHFYRYNITSRSAEFKVIHARIDRIGFEEFGIINPDKSQAVSRKIELIRQPDGGYFIDDVLPEVMNDDDLQVYFQDKLLLQMGQAESGEPVQVRSGDIESIIGPPEVHDDTVCVTAANGVQRLDLTYQSLEIKAEGTCFRHSRWNGQVTYLKLVTSDSSIGSGLKPGDSLADLLRQYPFAREAGYVIRGKSDTRNITLKFIIDEDQIEAIELTLN